MSLVFLMSACSTLEKTYIPTTEANASSSLEILSSYGTKAQKIEPFIVVDPSSMKNLRLRKMFQFEQLIFLQMANPQQKELDVENPLQWPAIYLIENKVQKIIDLRQRFPNLKFSHVYRDTLSKRIWAFLENIYGGPGSEIPVLLSEDLGKTWTHATDIPKPHHMAQLLKFEISSQGIGFAELILDHGILTDPLGRRGYDRVYLSNTVDWGKTWETELLNFRVLVNGAATSYENCFENLADWWKGKVDSRCELLNVNVP